MLVVLLCLAIIPVFAQSDNLLLWIKLSNTEKAIYIDNIFQAVELSGVIIFSPIGPSGLNTIIDQNTQRMMVDGIRKFRKDHFSSYMLSVVSERMTRSLLDGYSGSLAMLTIFTVLNETGQP
jgi:hypothetical protein